MLRVSQVLSDYADFSNVPPDVLQAAADRGTLVHDICAGILQGFFPPEIPEEAKGYVDSFLIFQEKYIREVIAVEAEVKHQKWGYVGHIDFGGRLTMFDAAVVLDWKTPVTKSKTWEAQVSAYLEAANETFPGHGWTRCGILQLSPEGKAPKMTWVEKPGEAFHFFIMKLQADQYFRNGGRK